MLTSVVVTAILISFVNGSPVDMFGRPPDKCSGNVANGETVKRGRYWYLCRDGQLEPKGCYSDTGAQLNLYDSYKSNGYVYECWQDSNGDLRFHDKGCVSDDGAEHTPDDTWQDDGYWYTCARNGDRLNIAISGCVFQGRRYALGEFRNQGGQDYRCTRHSDTTGWVRVRDGRV